MVMSPATVIARSMPRITYPRNSKVVNEREREASVLKWLTGTANLKVFESDNGKPLCYIFLRVSMGVCGTALVFQLQSTASEDSKKVRRHAKSRIGLCEVDGRLPLLRRQLEDGYTEPSKRQLQHEEIFFCSRK